MFSPYDPMVEAERQWDHFTFFGLTQPRMNPVNNIIIITIIIIIIILKKMFTQIESIRTLFNSIGCVVSAGSSVADRNNGVSHWTRAGPAEGTGDPPALV